MEVLKKEFYNQAAQWSQMWREFDQGEPLEDPSNQEHDEENKQKQHNNNVQLNTRTFM